MIQGLANEDRLVGELRCIVTTEEQATEPFYEPRLPSYAFAKTAVMAVRQPVLGLWKI